MDLNAPLPESPELVLKVIESFGEGIAVLDPDEIFYYINPAGAQILGYPREELIGKSAREIVSPDDLKTILTSTKERKTGKTSSHNYTVIGKDGKIRHVHVTSSPRYIDSKFAGSYSLFLDITDQIRDREAVAESEKRFKAVSDVISDFAVSFSFNANLAISIAWLSGSLSKITGYSSDELQQIDTWKKIGHPNDYMRLKDTVITNVVAQHEPFSIRTRILTKSGDIKWVEVFANPVFDNKANKLTDIIIAGREITEIKQAEDKLRLIEFIVDHAAESVYMIGKEGQILYVNESACHTLGYSRDQLLSLNAIKIDPHFQKERLEEIWERIREQKTVTFESTQLTHLGMAIPTEVAINFIRFEDDELLVAFIKDITARKEEEHLKNISFTIFQSINRSTSLNKLIIDIRNELSKILDTSSLKVILLNTRNGQTDEFYSRNGQIVVKKVDVTGTLPGLIFKRKQPALLVEDEIRKLKIKESKGPSGNIPRIWLGAPLFTGDEVIGIISLESDSDPNAFTGHHLEIIEFVCSQISLSIQRRLAEEALKISESNLRESNASKDKFFSIIAHDLRGPFNAIIGFSELLHTDYSMFDEDEKKAMIRNIHEASVSTFKLLENLLEWSRIQTGGSKPHLDSVDLSTITNSSLTFLKPQSEKKNIKLFSGIHYGTAAYCDENMITAVIRNLISNAIKFTNAGGEVRIGATIKDNCIEVVVADNGVGIAPDNLLKLFRLDESFKTGGTEGERGTGLGLILCKEFIELNGGKIWATSTVGRGSQFKFSLPKAT